MRLHDFTSHEVPTMTTERMRAKRVTLGKEVLRKYRVYLDTKYWIHLRDVAMGRPSPPEYKAIYDALLVLTPKTAICPASEGILVELLRQNSQETRLATARIIDRLSAGVAMQDATLRRKAELLNFVRRAINSTAHFPPFQAYGWTKVGYVLGEFFPEIEGLPAHTQNALQESFDALLWDHTLEGMVATLGDPLPERITDNKWMDSLSDSLNAGKFTYAHEVASFQGAFLAELGGILDFYSDEFASLLEYLFATDGRGIAKPTDDQRKEAGRQFRNLVYHAFRLGRTSTQLPSFHIKALIHAAVRWDRNRRFKPNDWLDFRHTVAALPYCSAFFTDRSMRALLCSAPLKLDIAYGCSIVSDPKEAIGVLQAVMTQSLA
jgi:hypothetical protein